MTLILGFEREDWIYAMYLYHDKHGHVDDLWEVRKYFISCVNSARPKDVLSTAIKIMNAQSKHASLEDKFHDKLSEFMFKVLTSSDE